MEIKSVDNGRVGFKLKVNMLKNFPANFKGKFKNNCEGLICNQCTAGENISQSYSLVCPALQDLRQDLDVELMENLITFFRRLRWIGSSGYKEDHDLT